MQNNRRNRQQLDIWPGFVDSLSALIMVVIFLLMIFVVAQFYLNQTIAGQTKEVGSLNQELNRLVAMLSLEEKKNQSLSQDLSRLDGQLQASLNSQTSLTQELAVARGELDMKRSEIATMLWNLDDLKDKIKALEVKRDELMADVASRDKTLDDAEKEKIQSAAEVARLNQQMEALRDQLARLDAILSESEAKDKASNAQIVDLGKRLNVALASKVNELEQYRSDFFGKLRAILGTREDILIVGDRFVFQSEVLFEPGSAELGIEGQLQLARLATTLKEIIVQIPTTVSWVLQIEGHTDIVPISTDKFSSNWELSSARALSVVHFLIRQGIPADRLSAAGFGEFQPLNTGTTPSAYKQNRRIELKLTSR